MTHAPAGHPAGSTVLLVDDEESVRSYGRRVLEGVGVQVVEAADGAAALRLVQERASGLDLVITDLRMPAFTGRAVAEVLSVFRPDLPVLAISADAASVADRRLPVLRKPFTPEELIEAVGRARPRVREIRLRTEEKRERAPVLQASAAARLEARLMAGRVDLVAAAIELRRLHLRSAM